MKAQASSEFLYSVMFLAVVLVFVYAVFYSEIIQAAASADEQSLALLCSSLAEKINSVDYYGAGFEFSTSLPQKIGAKNYTITAQSAYLQCELKSYSYTQTITAKNFTNGTAAPPFNIPPGARLIKNSGAGVVVS